ncbi:hypothetical protein N2W54_007277 [Lotmaria passim]
MSSEEVEHQPVEEHVEDAPAEKAAPNVEEQIAVPEDEPHAGEIAEPTEKQKANTPAEEDAAEEDDLVGKDLSDPRVFKMAMQEVDECYMSVIRGLGAFSQEDEEVFGNAVDICNDIITMEQNLFSDEPPYVADYIATYRAKTDAYNNSVQPAQTIPIAEDTPRDWEERRAYVDPSVPLMLPFDAERFKKKHPAHAQSEGTYHDLFYGDGSKVVFEPPADNKRKQIEEEQKNVYRPPKKPPQNFDPPLKKPMRVSADFVPSCADPKYPRNANHAKSTKKTDSKKGQRKSVSSQ